MGETRKRGGKYWIRSYRGGRRYEESARTAKWEVTRDLLRDRQAKIANGVPVSSKIARYRFEDAVKDIANDYAANARKSADELDRRIRLHLEPVFRGVGCRT